MIEIVVGYVMVPGWVEVAEEVAQGSDRRKVG